MNTARTRLGSTKLLLTYYWLARAQGMRPCIAWQHAQAQLASSIEPRYINGLV